MTHQKIIALMDGYSSAKPMPFATLAMKSGLLPDTLRTVQDQMIGTSPSPINRATITDIGGVREVYWPTGLVAQRSGPQGITINPLKRPAYIGRGETVPAAKVRPKTSIPEKETPMNPSDLRKTIHDKIVTHPGIRQDALIKHALQQCPDATEKQVKKALANMGQAKQIRTEGERGNLSYHLCAVVAQPPAKPKKPAKPAKKPAVGKVVLGKEAAALRSEPTGKPKRVAKNVAKDAKVPDSTRGAPHAKGVDPAFSVMLSDDDSLHIFVGDSDSVILNPDHVARLQRFLSRIQPAAGARA